MTIPLVREIRSTSTVFPRRKMLLLARMACAPATTAILHCMNRTVPCFDDAHVSSPCLRRAFPFSMDLLYDSLKVRGIAFGFGCEVAPVVGCMFFLR